VGCVVINWQELILDLRRAGFSCAQIGRKVGACASTISGLCCGQWEEPRYSLGRELIALHDKVKAAGLMKEAA